MRIALVAALLWLSGCASLTHGTKQELSFQANPEGATVTLHPALPAQEPPAESRADGWTPPRTRDAAPAQAPRLLGTTPLRITLDRADGQSIVFSKDGYKSLTMQLATRTNPMFWGNLVCCSLIGSIIDNATGAIWEYVPSQYFVTLIPLHATSIDSGSGQSQRDKAIVFIVRRYTAIMADLSRGSGEDWAALLEVLRINPGQGIEAREKLRAFAVIYPDAAAFATHVAQFYLDQ